MMKKIFFHRGSGCFRFYPGLILLILVSARWGLCAELQTAPDDDRMWPYYRHDNFENDALRHCWHVKDTEASQEDGILKLRNRADVRGMVVLKGLYQVSQPRIYLTWPWSVETELILPMKGPFNAGISITFGQLTGRGSQEDPGEVLLGSRKTGQQDGGTVALNAGFRMQMGQPVPYVEIDGTPLSLEGSLNPGKNRRAWLRIEGASKNQRTLRAGIKYASENEWTWISETNVDHRLDYAEPLALVNGPLSDATDSQFISASFESVRFEGDAFDPGVFHRAHSVFLDQQTKQQREEMDRAGLSVDYMRPDIPFVAEPSPRGKYTLTEVPDTLDLAERIRLSIHAITSCVDNSAGFEPYSHVYVNPEGWTHASVQYNPDMERGAPVFLHDFHGYNTGIGEGWIEALPLLRQASGSRLNMEISRRMFHNMRRMIGEDGLPRFPLRGRPWALFTTWWIDDPITGHSPDADLSMAGEYAWGRFLSTLAAWYMATGDPAIEDDIRKMVRAFDRLEHERPDQPQGMTTEFGVAQAFKATGDVLARDLAYRLLNATRKRNFKEDGSFQGHFHAMTFSVLAMAELGDLASDREYLEFVQKVYEYARSKGFPQVGYYPEGIDQDPPVMESCSQAHMPKIALILTRNGMGDYWDDIDRMVRNQLIENQLTEYEWIYTLGERIPDYEIPVPMDYDGVRDVGRRMLGGFASYARLNDFFKPSMHAPGPIVGCCTGNGAIALYYIWNSILEMKQGGLVVNLLLNRASPGADVNSYLPNEGRVEIMMKKALPLAVRLPSWIDKRQVTCRINGKDFKVKWNERYAKCAALNPGDRVEFDFPIKERTVQLEIGEVDATLTVRGNTVVDIEPDGMNHPLYQREKWRTDVTAMKKVTRFIPDRTYDW